MLDFPHRIGRAGRVRAAAFKTVRVAWKRTQSSPACQARVSRLVVKTRSIAPVAEFKFAEIALRWLSWIGAGMGGRANWVGRDVFMASIVFFRPFEVIPNGSQLLGRGRNGGVSGVGHE